MQKETIIVNNVVEQKEFIDRLMSDGDGARFSTYGKPEKYPAEIQATRYPNCGYGYTWELTTIAYPEKAAAISEEGETIAVMA